MVLFMVCVNLDKIMINYDKIMDNQRRVVEAYVAGRDVLYNNL